MCINKYFIFFQIILLSLSIQGWSQTAAPSHSQYHDLLKKHVSVEGRVNYKGFIKDSIQLNQYLTLLSKHVPNVKTWSKQEQMAYWINAYNAFTIKLIITYYPVTSIKDIGSKIQIPFVNTPWDIKFIRIGSEKMDLNNIEHGQLRKNFDDPRIHIALVCASKSCPILLNEPYTADKLNEQLNRQARAFLADPYRNKITAENAELSMIFKWYGMDFNKKGNSVRSFVNEHAKVKLLPDAKISYLSYDWGLND
jgi:exo-beta-1,3-glucanase (GH17 family)